MSDDKTKLSRRKFLLTVGAGGAAGAAAVAAATAGRAVPGGTETVEAAKREVAGSGASEHMRNYYRTARI